jgi:hypothetical protein
MQFSPLSCIILKEVFLDVGRRMRQHTKKTEMPFSGHTTTVATTGMARELPTSRPMCTMPRPCPHTKAHRSDRPRLSKACQYMNKDNWPKSQGTLIIHYSARPHILNRVFSNKWWDKTGSVPIRQRRQNPESIPDHSMDTCIYSLDNV